jgi:TldD protein
VPASSPVRHRTAACFAASLALALVAFAAVAAVGCAGGTPSPHSASANAAAPGVPAAPPKVVRVEPQSGGGAAKPPGLVALQAELERGMHDLSAKGKPPPYYIGYEVHDRNETTVMSSYGALVQSTERRTRILDADVRVGDYKLDSTHAIRSSDFDFSSAIAGHPVALPLSDDETALRTVAWAETDRRYEESAERLVKLKTQRTLKVADEDPSDDFSRESPVTYFGPPARLTVDVPAWESRLRRLSGRFRGQAEILDSDASLQATSLTLWLLNSEGTAIQTGRNYVRVFIEANARAEDGMELERFESFDAEALDGLGGEAAMNAAADSIITDLKALRRAPLAEPYTGPAILEGKAAGVFFHEIFGHRVEGHRQKSEEEGQTFAKKIGEPIMPTFVSVYDDPTLANLDGVDLNGFYRYDDEGVDARRATLVDAGILRGFLLSRSPIRGFSVSNGHGRRQEGRTIVSRQGNLVVQPSLAVSPQELRQMLRDEAKRQGKLYGLSFRDISGGFTNTARGGPQAFKVLPILVYRVWVDGRPDELVRGVDLVGTPLSALTKIMAAANDYQTFNGYCGAESGFVPVSATSPSLLVQQIETERRDKGSDKPPVLPAPSLQPAAPGQPGLPGKGKGTGEGALP